MGLASRLRAGQGLAELSLAACLVIAWACGGLVASKTVTAPQPVSDVVRFSMLTEGGSAYAGGLTSEGAAYSAQGFRI